MDMNANVCSLDGEVLHTFDAVTFTCPYTMRLGAVYGAGKYYWGSVRIYSCQIYDDGVLVRDLVPCINADGQIGMWDKVNGVFYGNAGTGEFITA